MDAGAADIGFDRPAPLRCDAISPATLGSGATPQIAPLTPQLHPLADSEIPHAPTLPLRSPLKKTVQPPNHTLPSVSPVINSGEVS